MKGFIRRIGSALALRVNGLMDLRREEQQIYRDALLKKKEQAKKKDKVVEVQKTPALSELAAPELTAS